MTRQVTPAALNFIKQCEGLRLYSYQDSVGVWTIGYGHTEGVVRDMVWTQREADAALEDDLAAFCDAVEDALSNDDGSLVPTTDNQFSAMVSLCYNIGPTHFNSSTVLKLHRAGGYTRAADAFLMWNKAGGQVLPGLERRRAGERVIYLTGLKGAAPEPADDGEPESGGRGRNGIIAWIKGLFK